MCPIQWQNWWMAFTLAALAWKLWSTAAATHRYMWYVSPIPEYVEWLNCVQRWTLFATCLRWCGCLCVRVWYYNYAEPLLQWPGRLAMGVWYVAVPAVASGVGLHAYTGTLHTACVLFSSPNHSMYYKPQNTWPAKRPHTFIKHATNIIRVAAKWNPLGNFALTLPWLESKYLWVITVQNF